MAGELWANGWRVLVLDFDEQSDLGKELFWRGEAGVDDMGKGLCEAITDGGPVASVIKGVGGRDGFDAIPGGKWLKMLEAHIGRGEVVAQSFGELYEALAPHYDLIIVDTPPSVVNQFHLHALLNAKFVISPVNNDEEDAVTRYSETVRARQNGDNPDLVYLGLVLFGWDRSNTPREEDFLRFEQAAGGVKAYRHPIHNAKAAVSDCRERGLLVGEYAELIEEVLGSNGSSFALSKQNLVLSGAGKRVTKKQRAALPPGAVVVGNVMLGGGLAGDYFDLVQEIIADLRQHMGDDEIDLRDSAMEVVS